MGVKGVLTSLYNEKAQTLGSLSLIAPDSKFKDPLHYTWTEMNIWKVYHESPTFLKLFLAFS